MKNVSVRAFFHRPPSCLLCAVACSSGTSLSAVNNNNKTLLPASPFVCLRPARPAQPPPPPCPSVHLSAEEGGGAAGDTHAHAHTHLRANKHAPILQSHVNFCPFFKRGDHMKCPVCCFTLSHIFPVAFLSLLTPPPSPVVMFLGTQLCCRSSCCDNNVDRLRNNK